mmetsp:Transcript_8448/g.15939  ORF Transcript_8448/g.15939 Transcript_8448/m.15939 type:complete len:303 (-) Transcript_8448:67-975(-)
MILSNNRVLSNRELTSSLELLPRAVKMINLSVCFSEATAAKLAFQFPGTGIVCPGWKLWTVDVPRCTEWVYNAIIQCACPGGVIEWEDVYDHIQASATDISSKYEHKKLPVLINRNVTYCLNCGYGCNCGHGFEPGVFFHEQVYVGQGGVRHMRCERLGDLISLTLFYVFIYAAWKGDIDWKIVNKVLEIIRFQIIILIMTPRYPKILGCILGVLICLLLNRLVQNKLLNRLVTFRNYRVDCCVGFLDCCVGFRVYWCVGSLVLCRGSSVTLHWWWFEKLDTCLSAVLDLSSKYVDLLSRLE